MDTVLLHSTDIESGERVSVAVPKDRLIGLPDKEPERSNFIASLMEEFKNGDVAGREVEAMVGEREEGSGSAQADQSKQESLAETI